MRPERQRRDNSEGEQQQSLQTDKHGGFFRKGLRKVAAPCARCQACDNRRDQFHRCHSTRSGPCSSSLSAGETLDMTSAAMYRLPEISLRWTHVWRRNLLVWRKLALASVM